MIGRTLSKRLERLERRMMAAREPVVFFGAREKLALPQF
jgi:hypothetical protein